MSSQLEDAFNEAVEQRIREMRTIPLIDSLREVAAGMLPQVARFTLADIEDAADALPPGVWPDTSAQHGVLLDQIRELHQENERLRSAARHAKTALRSHRLNWLALSDRLDTPYPDRPDSSPWSRFALPVCQRGKLVEDEIAARLDADQEAQDAARSVVSRFGGGES